MYSNQEKADTHTCSAKTGCSQTEVVWKGKHTANIHGDLCDFRISCRWKRSTKVYDACKRREDTGYCECPSWNDHVAFGSSPFDYLSVRTTIVPYHLQRVKDCGKNNQRELRHSANVLRATCCKSSLSLTDEPQFPQDWIVNLSQSNGRKSTSHHQQLFTQHLGQCCWPEVIGTPRTAEREVRETLPGKHFDFLDRVLQISRGQWRIHLQVDYVALPVRQVRHTQHDVKLPRPNCNRKQTTNYGTFSPESMTVIVLSF